MSSIGQMSPIIWYFFIGAIMILIGISIFISYFIVNSVLIAAIANPGTLNTTILQNGLGTIKTFDVSFAFILIGAALALFVTAFMIESHPIFLPINIIIYIILIFVSAIYSNTFMSFATTPVFISTANQFPTTIFLMRNLPFIITLLAGVNIIIMFIKRKGMSQL